MCLRAPASPPWSSRRPAAQGRSTSPSAATGGRRRPRVPRPRQRRPGHPEAPDDHVGAPYPTRPESQDTPRPAPGRLPARPVPRPERPRATPRHPRPPPPDRSRPPGPRQRLSAAGPRRADGTDHGARAADAAHRTSRPGPAPDARPRAENTDGGCRTPCATARLPALRAKDQEMNSRSSDGTAGKSRNVLDR